MCISNSIADRVQWIKDILESSGAKGIVYGNSGGKDCTLVGALCKMATKNVLGVIMPCNSSVNYAQDRDDALAAGKFFGIEQIEVDLSKTKDALVNALGVNLDKDIVSQNSKDLSLTNCNPRLRMTTLYAIAQAKGYLVAGTGNKDEILLGYFTKWGDGAYDFNPIADLTVFQVYSYLRNLNCPSSILTKAPSAGLYPGQTDEKDLGLKYSDVDAYLDGKPVSKEIKDTIERLAAKNAHKLSLPPKYSK